MRALDRVTNFRCQCWQQCNVSALLCWLCMVYRFIALPVYNLGHWSGTFYPSFNCHFSFNQSIEKGSLARIGCSVCFLRKIISSCLLNEDFHNFSRQRVVIDMVILMRMEWAGHVTCVAWGLVYKQFNRKTWSDQLLRSSCIWKDNIKMYLKIGSGLDLSGSGVHRLTPVSRVW